VVCHLLKFDVGDGHFRLVSPATHAQAAMLVLLVQASTFVVCSMALSIQRLFQTRLPMAEYEAEQPPRQVFARRVDTTSISAFR